MLKILKMAALKIRALWAILVNKNCMCIFNLPEGKRYCEVLIIFEDEIRTYVESWQTMQKYKIDALKELIAKWEERNAKD